VVECIVVRLSITTKSPAFHCAATHQSEVRRRFKAHSRLTVRVKRLWLYQRTVCQDRVTQTHLVLVDQRGVGGAIQSVGLQKRLFPSTFPMLIPSLSW
jgi:hypothetical protein